MELHEIQKQLKAPKSQWNSFGNYNYRNCEDILEAVKPLLGESVLILSDEMVSVDGRHYVKATARFTCGENTIEAYGWAREPLNRKGMDESQITGAASSYARKYALGGLFCLDDSKDDPDHKPPPEPKKPPGKSPLNHLSDLVHTVGIPEELSDSLVRFSTNGELNWESCKARKEDCSTAYKAIQQAAKKFPPDCDKPLLLRVKEFGKRGAK